MVNLQTLERAPSDLVESRGDGTQQPEEVDAGMILSEGTHGGKSVWIPMPEREESPSQTELEKKQKSEEVRVRREEEERGIGGLLTALEAVDVEKAAGNEAFKSKRNGAAVEHYERALKLLLTPPLAGTSHANSSAVLLHCNLAMVHLKNEEPERTIEACNCALLMDSYCVKALFRRAEALRTLCQFSRAVQDLERARSLEPKNQAVIFALEDTEELLYEDGDNDSAVASTYTSTPSLDDTARQQIEESAQAFAKQCMDRIAVEYQEKQESVAEQVILQHNDVGSDGKASSSIGKIMLEGAFTSSHTLKEALAWVRSQHTTAFASFACLLVTKSKMLYPLVWWAGPWPFPIDQDGVFVEVTEPSGSYTCTWFMPLARGDSHLQQGQPLDPECSIMFDLPGIFPQQNVPN